MGLIGTPPRSGNSRSRRLLVAVATALPILRGQRPIGPRRRRRSELLQLKACRHGRSSVSNSMAHQDPDLIWLFVWVVVA